MCVYVALYLYVGDDNSNELFARVIKIVYVLSRTRPEQNIIIFPDRSGNVKLGIIKFDATINNVAKISVTRSRKDCPFGSSFLRFAMKAKESPVVKISEKNKEVLSYVYATHANRCGNILFV